MADRLDMTGRFSLEGKVALITGGSRGLGHAMALGFAAHGADIIIASRKLDACEAAAAEVRALGRRAMPYACHVGHWGQLSELVDAAYKEFGKVDVLVNNAGMSPLYPALVDISEDLFDKVIDVNLKGPFRLSALVGDRMHKGSGGCIINISSTASSAPSPNSEPYGAAKAGLNALTRSLAFAYGPNVRVNCIMAGPFLISPKPGTWKRSISARKPTWHYGVVAKRRKSSVRRCTSPVRHRLSPPARSCAWTAATRKQVSALARIRPHTVF